MCVVCFMVYMIVGVGLSGVCVCCMFYGVHDCTCRFKLSVCVL